MDVRQQLTEERERVVARLARLRRDHDAIVESVRLDAPDDEHDPEGATLGWEREQLRALIAAEEQRLVDVDAALDRVADGTHGRCESCGEPIGAARLEARPSARTCIGCAA